MDKGLLTLIVSIPITSLKAPKAREYLESLPCPAPATVYGMLLSLIGEEDRHKYVGTELAIGILKEPAISTVLRTAWRIKNKKLGPGNGNNKRPDFQELLTGLELLVVIRESDLAQKVATAFDSPENISRYGGLSLGESTHLVDEIRPWRPSDPDRATLLIHDTNGDLTLPVWVDHVGSSGTIFRQYALEEVSLESVGSLDCWTTIVNQ